MSWVTQREVSCNPMWDEPNWNDEEKEIPSNLQVKYMKIVESLFSDDSWLILPYLNLVLLRDDMTDFWHFLYLMLWRVNWKSEQSSPKTGMAKSTSLDDSSSARPLKTLPQLCPLNGQWACKCHSAYRWLVKKALQFWSTCPFLLIAVYKCKIVNARSNQSHLKVFRTWLMEQSVLYAGLVQRKRPEQFCRKFSLLNLAVIKMYKWMSCSWLQRLWPPAMFVCALLLSCSPECRSMEARSRHSHSPLPVGNCATGKKKK